jgi:hypothetical protein
MCIQRKTLAEKCKEAHEIWRDKNPATRINIDAQLLSNHKTYILKNQSVPTVEIDEIKEKPDLNYENME